MALPCWHGPLSRCYTRVGSLHSSRIMRMRHLQLLHVFAICMGLLSPATAQVAGEPGSMYRLDRTGWQSEAIGYGEFLSCVRCKQEVRVKIQAVPWPYPGEAYLAELQTPEQRASYAAREESAFASEGVSIKITAPELTTFAGEPAFRYKSTIGKRPNLKFLVTTSFVRKGHMFMISSGTSRRSLSAESAKAVDTLLGSFALP